VESHEQQRGHAREELIALPTRYSENAASPERGFRFDQYLSLKFIERQSGCSNPMTMEDFHPILWKWLVRFIWVGSIVFFQILELHRYLSGQTYRPFFGLYAAVLFALVLWFTARAIRSLQQRRVARS
jgi:hypothetical protein